MTRPWCHVTLSEVVSRLHLWNIILSTVVCEDRLARPDTAKVFEVYFGVFGDGTRPAVLKINYEPDSSSLKPGSGATEGVLD